MPSLVEFDQVFIEKKPLKLNSGRQTDAYTKERTTDAVSCRTFVSFTGLLINPTHITELNTTFKVNVKVRLTNTNTEFTKILG